jgi:hypothetical protein
VPIHNQNTKWAKRCHWQGWSGESGQHRRIGMFHANSQTSLKWKIEEIPWVRWRFFQNKNPDSIAEAQEPKTHWESRLHSETRHSLENTKISKRGEQVHIIFLCFMYLPTKIVGCMLYFHVHGSHGINLKLNGLVCIRLLFRNLLLSAAPPVPAIYRWDCESSRDLDDASYRLNFLFDGGSFIGPFHAPKTSIWADQPACSGLGSWSTDLCSSRIY